MPPSTTNKQPHLHSYLTADYERHTFNISACTWEEGVEEDIMTILSSQDDPDSGSDPNSNSGSSSTSLGRGPIAGIAVGALAFLLLVAGAAVLCIRRQRKKSAYAASASEPPPDPAVMTGPVHNAPPPGGASKFYSPETVGTRSGTGGSNSNTGSSVPIVASSSSQQQSSSQGSSVQPQPQPSKDVDAELDGDAPQIYQLHGVSKWPNEGGVRVSGKTKGPPVYHELADTEVGVAARTDDYSDQDQVSTVGTLDNPVDASSDLVSPTTPVHHPGFRASLNNDARRGSLV